MSPAVLGAAFAPATTAYAASLPGDSAATSVTLAYTRGDTDAAVRISAVTGAAAAVTADADGGTPGYQIAVGSPQTVISVTITAPDGAPKVYVITIPVTQTDYDDDNNNLIEIRTLAQLNAMRYDLDGNGAADDAANNAAYAAAFPFPVATTLGCPYYAPVAAPAVTGKAIVISAGRLYVHEGGAVASYTIKLSQQPAAPPTSASPPAASPSAAAKPAASAPAPPSTSPSATGTPPRPSMSKPPPTPTTRTPAPPSPTPAAAAIPPSPM